MKTIKNFWPTAGLLLFILSFSPNDIRIRTKTKDAAMLTLLQNHYPGWNVTIDGKKDVILISNYCLMSVYLTAGEHVVEFTYHPRNVLIAFWISLFSIVAGLLFLMLRHFFYL